MAKSPKATAKAKLKAKPRARKRAARKPKKDAEPVAVKRGGAGKYW